MIIELLGTMFLVWYGGMAISVTAYKWTDESNGKATGVYAESGTDHGDQLFGIALCHGLILAIWIYAGAAAGADCHFNPAVTLGFILGRKCNLVKGISYMVAQLAGSFLGALMTMYLNYDGKAYGPALATVSDAMKKSTPEAYWKETTWYQGGLVEFLNTFFLMMVVLSFTQKNSIPKCAFGGAIGLVLTCLICGAGPLTGCAANPFRALGPCVFDGNWFDLIVYMTFPFLGALFATILYKMLLEDEEDSDEENRDNKLADVKGEFEVNAD